MKKFLLVFGLVLAMAIPALAADSTSLFNEKVLGTKIEKASNGGVPVGTIIAWPVSSNPDDAENWLECNGQGISPSAYPELYAVVGGNVPDYRGLFLRGGGGNSAALGVLQNDELKSHTHNLYYGPNNTNTLFAPNDKDYGRGSALSSSSTSAYGGAETRPVNRAVRYLIRAKP